MKQSEVMRMIARKQVGMLRRLRDGIGAALDLALEREVDYLLAGYFEADASPEVSEPEKPAEPLKVGDRVVVKDELVFQFDKRFAGMHGVIVHPLPCTVGVRLDDTEIWRFLRRDIRREREDEKPAPASPRILASPDGRFKMQVWVKPNRLEAQILEQPEEWRGRNVNEVAGGIGLEVRSLWFQAFDTNVIFIRGDMEGQDSVIFSRNFPADSCRDVYLAKVEVAVAAMPRVEPKVEFRVGQWVEHSFRRPEKGRVVSISPVGRTLDIEVLGGEQFCDSQDEFKPCSPVCTAEQMSILPSDTKEPSAAQSRVLDTCIALADKAKEHGKKTSAEKILAWAQMKEFGEVVKIELLTDEDCMRVMATLKEAERK